VGYARMFLLFGVASIMGGMSLQTYIGYAPTFGWLAGVVFFVGAAYLANQAKSEHKKVRRG
jgi:ABC-type multidrug transport system permease subunit